MRVSGDPPIPAELPAPPVGIVDASPVAIRVDGFTGGFEADPEVDPGDVR